jgi:dipeptidyl aminopeptidase/acylaminoacyl peptidase
VQHLGSGLVVSFTVGALGAGLSILGCGLPAAAAPMKFEPRDVFALEYASEPEIRPDGSEIAYVRNTTDIMVDRERRSLWLVDRRTGVQTPISAGPGSASHPRWSPDGTRLAYVAAGEGEQPQLYVRWMDAGVSAKLATLPQAPSDIAWSPDGKTIAFTMFTPEPPAKLGAAPLKPEGAKWAEPLEVITSVTFRFDEAGWLKPGHDQIYVIPSDGGAPRALTTDAHDNGGQISWTPDGKAILFSANHAKDWQRDVYHAAIFRLDPTTGDAAALFDRDGPIEEPVASPNGRLIAFVGFENRHHPYQDSELYVMDADGQNARAIAPKLDRPVGHPVWSADGKSLYVQMTDHALTKVVRIGLDGRVETVAGGLAGDGIDRPYTGGSYSVSPRGMVAFTAGAADHPADVAVAEAGKTTRLTRLNDNVLGARDLAKLEPLAVKSSHDGLPIDAWMLTPPGFDPAKKYPMILEVHGGPFASYGPVWASEFQLYAAAGYVVVYANPRGSTSYGDAFSGGITYNYPGYDFDDLMSAVDAAIAKGSVDPNQLYVTGGSGGGLMTAWIVGKTHRFRAAVSQKPVINWVSQCLTTDSYVGQCPYWFEKPVWEDEPTFWSHSPLSLVANVTTPTLVMGGTEDHRTPPSEAEQFYGALQLRGVPTALVRVPGASHHGLALRPSQEAAEVSAILAWFEKYKAD